MCTVLCRKRRKKSTAELDCYTHIGLQARHFYCGAIKYIPIFCFSTGYRIRVCVHGSAHVFNRTIFFIIYYLLLFSLSAVSFSYGPSSTSKNPYRAGFYFSDRPKDTHDDNGRKSFYFTTQTTMRDPSCDIPWLFRKSHPAPRRTTTERISCVCVCVCVFEPSPPPPRCPSLAPSHPTRSHTIARLSLSLSRTFVARSLALSVPLSRRLHTPTGVPAARGLNHDDDRRLVFHDFPVRQDTVVPL
ncbi:unnamed protein product [Aphis gossypii]|uniref:Uncharacterized protein n=1 Tax=Aphis gossypii TaxID=80765 RepID=A0A9P0NLP4_APHGO|nr:unnamed protein product [Aphis gossypii]